MVISTGLKILYSFLYRKYINHIHLQTSFFYPPSLTCSGPEFKPQNHKTKTKTKKEQENKRTLSQTCPSR
jgi:hypothetical protein